jgi:hypothetical protein
LTEADALVFIVDVADMYYYCDYELLDVVD